MLKPVRLDDVRRARHQTLTVEFREMIDGFESLVPVEGSIQLTHGSTFVELAAQASTIVTLTCHRCLKQFNHRLSLEFGEILIIEAPSADPLPVDLEIDSEDLAERIPPHGEIDLMDWAYQHLHLSMPMQTPCASDCSGIAVDPASQGPQTDPRWAILQSLKP